MTACFEAAAIICIALAVVASARPLPFTTSEFLLAALVAVGLALIEKEGRK